MKLVLLLLALLFVPSVAKANERIAGEIADPADWPSFVAFSDKATDLYNRCAGVLIRPRWVLTAPNGCMADRRDDAFAYIGASDSNPYNGRRVAIEQVYLHPRYSSKQMVWSVNPTWNIGLVKLRQAIEGIPQPQLSEVIPNPGTQINMAGLGNSMLIGDEDGYYPGLLQSTVDVVSKKECTKYIPVAQGSGNRSIFCAFTPQRGPCTLDEGTAAFQGDKIVGVFNLIWNGEGNPVCPEDKGAGYYTALAPALPWVRSVLRRGYDKGRFLEHGAYIFADREINLYSWTNQDVFQPRVRLSEKICLLYGKRCFAANKWITLRQNITSGARRGNYWMFPEGLRFTGKKRCLRGVVQARFLYSGENNKRGSLHKSFRACVRRNT